MSRVGVVLATRGDVAEITTSLRGDCEGCSNHDACDVGDGDTEGPPQIVTARNPVDARRGDIVSFDLAGHTELAVSMLVWGVPLVGMLLGAAIGAGVAVGAEIGQDVPTLIGAVAGFFGAFAVIRRIDAQLTDDTRIQPLILKVVERCQETE